MSKEYTFIDLFAGIGGTRLGFEQAGANCVFTSEWDRWCQCTYMFNFVDRPHGDIKEIDENTVPDHDILVAGFPCQPFSIAGVSKKKSLGKAHGFDDIDQGNLFFDIVRILKSKRPRAFLLENVKNLKSHDGGKTFRVITSTLNNLDYKIFYKVIDGKDYVPQHRERIFLVGFDKRRFPALEKFLFPAPPPENNIKIKDILEKKVDSKYTLSDKLWSYLQKYAEGHRKKGNGFGFGLVNPQKDVTTRTLSARYYKDGSEILIYQKNKNPRRLTPRECARLMGFPDNFKIPVSDTQAYKQFGNAVVVPLVRAIAKKIIITLDKESNNGSNKQKKTQLEYVADQRARHKAGVKSAEISV